MLSPTNAYPSQHSPSTVYIARSGCPILFARLHFPLTVSLDSAAPALCRYGVQLRPVA